MSDHSPPRVLIIGAGSRGNAYARAIDEGTGASVVAIAEPIEFKREELGRKHIWKNDPARSEQQFEDWRDFPEYEKHRRKRKASGESVEDGIDAVFVCVLDTQHAEIITALGPLNLHIMSEKPLATTLDDCLNIYASMLPDGPGSCANAIFGIGHVLRYSPHNMLLRSLLLEQRVTGDIISIEHTEPIGYWHFAHSYVRGNWRKESKSAPSLLTKSCHDIDLLLWLLCAPNHWPDTQDPPHLPSTITSVGHVSHFRRARKPLAAGSATNCLSCPVESSCIYSAKKIYVDRHWKQGKYKWPLSIVDPEIEDCVATKGASAAKEKLLSTLAKDYDTCNMSTEEIDARPWFGRCVWESANDVCDDQTVTISWDDDIKPQAFPNLVTNPPQPKINRFAKTAIFHQIAQTEAQCERRGRVYGTTGEIAYDSKTIRIFNFATGKTQVHKPSQSGVHHGGGDEGLVQHFIRAVQAVKSGKQSVLEAQKQHVGCTLEDVIRSHAAVFAAEEARRTTSVVDWPSWWAEKVETPLMNKKGWAMAY